MNKNQEILYCFSLVLNETSMTKKEKYNAIISLVKEKHQIRQPILIGTTSVENSEILSNLLL